MKPLILVSTSSNVRDRGLRRVDSLTGQNYSEALALFGALPLMVSNLDPDLAEEYAARADGLLLTGGADIDPALFGEEPEPGLGHVDIARDHFEIALYRAARARGLPVLGVCRGIQVISVAEGGTILQHITPAEGGVQHDQSNIGSALSHSVWLESDSMLGEAFGSDKIRTNSFHHQAVKSAGRGLRVTGRTSDGLIEAVEAVSGPPVLGVQWHPEMSFRDHPEQAAPFDLFVRSIKASSQRTV